jgi:hypothetical protein
MTGVEGARPGWAGRGGEDFIGGGKGTWAGDFGGRAGKAQVRLSGIQGLIRLLSEGMWGVQG